MSLRFFLIILLLIAIHLGFGISPGSPKFVLLTYFCMMFILPLTAVHFTHIELYIFLFFFQKQDDILKVFILLPLPLSEKNAGIKQNIIIYCTVSMVIFIFFFTNLSKQCSKVSSRVLKFLQSCSFFLVFFKDFYNRYSYKHNLEEIPTQISG